MAYIITVIVPLTGKGGENSPDTCDYPVLQFAFEALS